MVKISLRLARVIRNLSQAELGLLVGLSQATVSMIEAGLRVPTPEQAEKFNAILEMNIFELSESKNGGEKI